MEDKKISWWQKIRKPLGVVGIIVVCLLIIGLIVAITSGGYLTQNWDWTGFKEGTTQITITTPSKTNYSASVEQPYKTLWDWLGLLGVLAIPVVVGLGVAWYTAQQGKVSDRENTDNQHEKALQDYIDKMSELILDKDNPLRKSKPGDEVRTIAQVRTATILRILDPNRCASLIWFLSQADILELCTDSNLSRINLHGIRLYNINLSHIGFHKSDLSGGYLNSCQFKRSNLRDANLSKAQLLTTNFINANLTGANLAEADLRGTVLERAELHGADFTGANLLGAVLKNAYLNALEHYYDTNYPSATLKRADLYGADLKEADLSGVDLTGARLKDADFGAANLRGAKVDVVKLKQEAKSLKGAIMPDGKMYRYSSGANLVGVDLKEADLRGVDLKEADLRGTNLTGTNLTGTKFQGAKYNTKPIPKNDEQGKPVTNEQGNPVMTKATQWPQGFDPIAAEANCVDC